MRNSISLLLIFTCITVLGQISESERKANKIPYNESLSEEEYRINTLTEYPSSHLDNDQSRLSIKDSISLKNSLKEALEKLCSAIRTSDKNVLKEFSGLTPEELLTGFTNEYDPDAKPECSAEWNSENRLNFKATETEYYMYAIEYGDGSGYLMLVYESDKWIAKKFVFNEVMEKLRNESKVK